MRGRARPESNVTGDGPLLGGWGKLIAAKAVCCGVLLLFLTGTLTVSGVMRWFRGGDLAWLALALAGAGAMGGTILWRRQRRRGGGATEPPRRLETKGMP